MQCDGVRQFVLAHDWDAEACHQAAEAIHHWEQCPACQSAVRDYDTLRLLLTSEKRSTESCDQPDSVSLAVPDRYVGSALADANRLGRERETASPKAHRTSTVPAGLAQRSSRGVLSSAPRRLPRRKPVWHETAFKIAASILILAGVFVGGRHSSRPTVSSSSNMTAAVVGSRLEPFAPTSAQDEISAFRTISQEYGGQTRWMLVSDKNQELGTAQVPVLPQKKLLFLGLGLSQGTRVLFEPHLIVVAGQSAEVDLPLSAGQSLHYQIGTSVEEPTRLTLRAELRRNVGNEPLAAVATTLQLKHGQSLPAGQLRTVAGDYDLKLGFMDAAFSSVAQ